MTPRRLVRDSQRRWVGGVCAGVANYLAVPVFFVRLCMIPLIMTPLLPFTVIAYVIACVVIPPSSQQDQPVDTEREEFRRSALAAPSATFGQVRHRMRDLEHRIRRMEAYVTSPEFEIDRELIRRPRPVRDSGAGRA